MNKLLTIVVGYHWHEVAELQNRIYIVYHRLLRVADRQRAIDQEVY